MTLLGQWIALFIVMVLLAGEPGAGGPDDDDDRADLGPERRVRGGLAWTS
ncbi:hypothetical protein [Litchfieldella rifensis]|uniref:Uncharacterized protein n=1 Tax=Litchfieldella rifensis TaxID=762643 RepID=A0ABV7LJ86_9GAMM